jgi:Flp pilus assembly protein TadD
LAAALRLGGRHDRAVEVAQEALRRLGEDAPLLRTLGLAQLAGGRPQDALRPLALVARADPQDARTRMALGVALDQLQRFDQARAAYQEALAIVPDDTATLTNLGVSFLLAGQAEEAETILRQAAGLPNAPVESRQNLAIALGLQGEFEEAERVLRIDLAPDDVAESLAYLRGLFEDPRSWGALSDELRR